MVEWGMLELIPADTAQGYTLNKLPVHHRSDTKTQTNIHAYIHIYGQFRVNSLPNLLVFRL